MANDVFTTAAATVLNAVVISLDESPAMSERTTEAFVDSAKQWKHGVISLLGLCNSPTTSIVEMVA